MQPSANPQQKGDLLLGIVCLIRRERSVEVIVGAGNRRMGTEWVLRRSRRSAAAASRSRSQRAVLPSISVKRNVTVLLGRSAITRSRVEAARGPGRVSHAV